MVLLAIISLDMAADYLTFHNDFGTGLPRLLVQVSLV